MNKRELNIMNKTNFSIEGMNFEELETKILKESKINPNIKDIYDRNQYKYITRFFSEFLQVDGKYVKNTRFKDLIILYYIDFYIKERISGRVLKVEKYFNVAILNSFEKDNISIVTGDQQNTFGRVFKFFKERFKDEEKQSVVDEMNRIYETNFRDIDSFEKHISNIVSLRNFCIHHYSIVSYEYAGKIKNGEVHQKKDGEGGSLREAINSLSHFLNVKSSNKLMKKVISICEQYNFSTDDIKNSVIEQIKDIINFEALREVKTENQHFSIIDLINDRYLHAKDIEDE